MGQKCNPIGNRLGIIRGWDSMWYGEKRDFGQKLVEDHKIRNYLNARINKGGISRIVIERTLGKLIVTIHTSKPGIIIGKGGTEVDRIKEELKKLTKKEDVQINIMEIRRPELDAMIVGETIARQIEGRVSYKRAIKMAISTAMRMGAEGIKIKAGGRLNGSEIARSEEFKQGRTPLHTYRMDIDYASVYAMTVYGKIGLKILIVVAIARQEDSRELKPAVEIVTVIAVVTVVVAAEIVVVVVQVAIAVVAVVLVVVAARVEQLVAAVQVAQQVDADNNIVLEYFNKYCNNVTTKKIKTS